MAGGRFREAMSDMAETLRRLFKDPPSHALDPAIDGPSTGGTPLLEAASRAGDLGFLPPVGDVPVLAPASVREEGFHWEPRLLEEPGLASWDAGIQACELPLFRAEGCARLEVPALPRAPRVRAEAPGSFRTSAFRGLEALPGPRARQAPCAIAAPRSRRDLETALALPVAFPGEDIPALSKALWMRYTLKLVKETGQNIRNLDVVGLYRIPARGVRQVNHQAATGRLLVSLGSEAQGAPRAPFILARRKDDDSVVCCYVEDV